jgi:hypothetical protein
VFGQVAVPSGQVVRCAAAGPEATVVVVAGNHAHEDEALCFCRVGTLAVRVPRVRQVAVGTGHALLLLMPSSSSSRHGGGTMLQWKLPQPSPSSGVGTIVVGDLSTPVAVSGGSSSEVAAVV